MNENMVVNDVPTQFDLYVDTLYHELIKLSDGESKGVNVNGSIYTVQAIFDEEIEGNKYYKYKITDPAGKVHDNLIFKDANKLLTDSLDINDHENRRAELDKQRLFLDMDGTIAKFEEVDTLETLYEEGYFRNLDPIPSVINAIKLIITNYKGEVEVYSLSAFLSDSKYAEKEKNEWLDVELPEIDAEHRIFIPYGEDKKNYVPGGIRETDYLLDDYTKNLELWGTKGIKILNGINHTNGTWQGDRIANTKKASEISKDIMSIMKEGGHIMDQVKKSVVENNTKINEAVHNEDIPKKEIGSNQQPKVKFFVAECIEFKQLGKVYEDIPTIEKAFEIYSSIPAEKHPMGNGIGIVVDYPQDNFYHGAEIGLFSGEIDDLSLYGNFYQNIEDVKKAVEYLNVKIKYKNISNKIKAAGFKVNHPLVNKMVELDELTGKENSLRDLKSLKSSNGLKHQPEADKLLNSICDEFKAQEIESKKSKSSSIEIQIE